MTKHFPLAVGHFPALGGDWFIILDSHGQPIAQDQMRETQVEFGGHQSIKISYEEFHLWDEDANVLYVPIAVMKAWLAEYERLNGPVE